MTAYICRRFIPTTSFLVDILLKENQNCRVIGGLAQPQWYFWPKTDCCCQTHVWTFEGAHFIASAPGRRKPQLRHCTIYIFSLGTDVNGATLVAIESSGEWRKNEASRWFSLVKFCALLVRWQEGHPAHRNPVSLMSQRFSSQVAPKFSI